MKAMLSDREIADSDDVVTADGYYYFRRSEVQMRLLEAADKTESDHACPHGVRFFDLVIDATRHPRVAWSYEAPRPSLAHVAQRIGFWKDVVIR